MLITKNHIDVSESIKDILFNENTRYLGLHTSVVKKKFNNITINSKYYVLDFYQFYILMWSARYDKNNYSNLDYNFFNNLSIHKNKISFCGFFDNQDNTFTPSEVLYYVECGKLGIYVRKHIVKSFKDCGVELARNLKLNNRDDGITHFMIL